MRVFITIEVSVRLDSIVALMPVKLPVFEDSVGIQGTFLASAGVADTLKAPHKPVLSEVQLEYRQF